MRRAARTFVDNRPAAVAQRELADAISDSPRVVAQLASLRAVLGSSETAAVGWPEAGFANASQCQTGHVRERRASPLVVQRWPTPLPTEKAPQEFPSLEEYFRYLAQLRPETAKKISLSLLHYLFPWKPEEPFEIRHKADEAQAVLLQGKLGISQGDWAGLVFEGRARMLGSPREQPLTERPQSTTLEPSEILGGVAERIERENKPKEKFRLLYNKMEMVDLVRHAAFLGIDATECVEIILIGCRILKPRSAEQLKDQMHNLKLVVGKRAYPFKFHNREYLRDLSGRLIDLVRNMTLFEQRIPADDVRIQGSSLRTPLAEDVDIAVFVSPEEFGTLCATRYRGRIKKKVGKEAPVLVELPKTYEELVALARLCRQDPAYTIDARKFADMLLGGKFDAKTESSDKALIRLTETIKSEFSSLNIESVTILVRGGPFDLKPYMQLHPPHDD